MGAKPEQCKSITFFVIPYKQEIAFNMTFKATGVFHFNGCRRYFSGNVISFITVR